MLKQFPVGHRAFGLFSSAQQSSGLEAPCPSPQGPESSLEDGHTLADLATGPSEAGPQAVWIAAAEAGTWQGTVGALPKAASPCQAAEPISHVCVLNSHRFPRTPPAAGCLLLRQTPRSHGFNGPQFAPLCQGKRKL